MIKRASLRVVCLLAVVFAGANVGLGCTVEQADDSGGECNSDSDCKGDRVCSDGSCVDPSSSEGGSSSTGESCSGDEQKCDGEALLSCESGEFVEETCDDICEGYGFEGDGCDSSKCQCGDTTNARCANALSAFCFCAGEAGAPCTDEQATNLYVGCHQDDPEIGAMVDCFENYIDGNVVDCTTAANVCL